MTAGAFTPRGLNQGSWFLLHGLHLIGLALLLHYIFQYLILIVVCLTFVFYRRLNRWRKMHEQLLNLPIALLSCLFWKYLGSVIIFSFFFSQLTFYNVVQSYLNTKVVLLLFPCPPSAYFSLSWSPKPKKLHVNQTMVQFLTKSRSFHLSKVQLLVQTGNFGSD